MRLLVVDDEARLADALALSRAMSYKNSLAGLDLGGGKAVIIGDPATAKTEALLKASQKLGEKLYAEQAAQQAAAGGGGGAGGGQQAEATQSARSDDDVVDAEFKEVKKG